MKYLIVNAVLAYGSTGHIVLDLAKEFDERGDQVRVAYGRLRKVSQENKADLEKYGVRIGNDMDVCFHALYTRLTDKHGLASKMATRNFLKWANGFNPDVLWLHNIHDYYINYELLFDWIKSRPQMKVQWTLHDCWSFTGHCSHFIYAKCNKWRSMCKECPQLSQYPKSFFDASTKNYYRKRNAFTGVRDLTLITPSKWLKEKVQQSFLSEYDIEVKYNTINTDVFKPTPSNFKEDHGFQNKQMVLGVANIWNERKGYYDFIELSRRLDYHEYQIVMVGLSQKQIKALKKNNVNILGLPRTHDVMELVKIYSAANVFINPTQEDTFPTVNMEAEACGTKVITYDIGGCRETIHRSDSQAIQATIDKLYDAITANKCV